MHAIQNRYVAYHQVVNGPSFARVTWRSRARDNSTIY
jgi:hypothetical protein